MRLFVNPAKKHACENCLPVLNMFYPCHPHQQTHNINSGFVQHRLHCSSCGRNEGLVIVRSPFPLSVSRVLYFNCVNLKTVTQAEQKANSLAGWLLCCGFCVPANVLALWRWQLKTSPIVFPLWCNYWLCVSSNVPDLVRWVKRFVLPINLSK